MFKLIDDLLFSVRLLRKSPLFTAISVTVVALGLTVAICNYALNYEMSKPPPFPGGDRMVGVKIIDSNTGLEVNPDVFNGFAYNLVKARAKSFESLGAFNWQLNAVLSTDSSSRRYTMVELAPSLMAMTEVTAVLGRTLSEADVQPGSSPVVLLSHKVWRNQFAGAADVVGSTTYVRGEAHTVIGVMPEGFSFPYSQDLWAPLRIAADISADDSARLRLVGRLKEGVSEAAAAREINAALDELARILPQRFEAKAAKVVPLSALRTQGSSDMGGLLDAITVVVLLLASLNFSTLLFARAQERAQELAVRQSLGASRWQLRKQILVESGLICAAGSFAAILASIALLNALQGAVESMMASMGAYFDINLRLYPAVLLHVLLATMGMWLVSAWTAAYRVGKQSTGFAVEAGSRGSSSRARNQAMQAVVGVEVVFSFFLLIVCGLFVASVVNLYEADFGTRADSVFVGRLELSASTFPDADRTDEFVPALEEELGKNLQYQGLAVSNAPPGGWYQPQRLPYALEDRELIREGKNPVVGVGAISPDYFSVLGIDLRAGRSLERGDSKQSLQVAVIDELFANTMWPGESPLGKRIQLNPGGHGEWLTVVGVSANIVHGQPLMTNLTSPTLYRPLSQADPETLGPLFLMANYGPDVTTADARQFLQQAVGRIDRHIVLEDLAPLGEYQARGLDVFTIIGQIVVVFSLVALLLSVIGIYGIVSRNVYLRTKEMGIRKALGSSDKQVLNIYLRQGIRYLLLGTVVGGGAAVLFGSGLAAIFPEILTHMPLVGTAVLLTLALLIFLATYIPSRYSIAIEPGDALRYE